MKKLLILGMAVFSVSLSHATHFFRNNASNINAGTLDPARLDPSSVTMFGNGNVPLSRIDYSSISAIGPITRIGVPLNLNDEGSTQGGIVTTLDCVGSGVACTQSGTTATVTINAGGGSSTREFDLYVGPPGASGVDAYVQTLEQFNMALASVNARGLTYPSTATARIFFASGIYKGIFGATVPAGVELVAGSSVVWINNFPATTTVMSIYGTVRGFKFDGSGNSNTGRAIVLRTGGKLLDFEVYNASVTPSAANNYKTCMICIDDSSSTIVRGKMYNLRMGVDTTQIGNDAPFKVVRSTDYDIQLDVNFSSWPAENVRSSFMHIAKSERGVVHDSNFVGAGSTLLVFDSKIKNFYFTKNTIDIARPLPTYTANSGFFFAGGFFDGAVDVYQSTGTISIDNNRISISSAQASVANIIYLGSDVVSVGAKGFRIAQNAVSVNNGVNASILTFITTQANSAGTVIQGNNVRGISTFIADSGANTLHTSQGNTLNYVEQ